MVQPHNSPTGNHVIQKAITILFSWAKDAQDKGEEDLCSFYLRSIEPIVREIIDSAEEMAKHAYGCRASQRMIEHCVEPLKNEILDAFVACRGALLTHTYGNYVIQKMLVHGRPSDRSDIFQSITTRVVKFSKQKQASNVVESMIRLGNAEQRQSIVREILTVSHFSSATTSAPHTPVSNVDVILCSAFALMKTMKQRAPSFRCLKTPMAITS